MSKKTLLSLCLLILAVLIFFCIREKIGEMAPKETNQITKPVVEKIVKEVEPKEEKVIEVAEVKQEKHLVKVEEKVEKKDIGFKIDKSLDEVAISGVLNSKNDFLNLSQKYQGLKSRGLKFDKQAENPEVFGLVLNLNSVMDKLKSGYLEYHNGNLIVDGVVATKEDKELIDATLNSISNIKVSSNIIVEEPKATIEHVGKLSITKQGDEVTVSGIFSSEKEVDDLINLLKSKDLNVKKELCVVDSDLKEDRWKVPFVLVIDDFIQFTKGTIQFDKDTFSVIGETQVDGVKDDLEARLAKAAESESIVFTNDVTFVKPKSEKEDIQDKINSILKLKSVRFITATGTLLNESKPILDEVAQILLEHPNIKVEIAGHTDSDGDAKTNLILSQHRADTVKKYLVKKGVKAKNLKAIGYGEGKPLVKNNSEENKQINRRVEFIILGE